MLRLRVAWQAEWAQHPVVRLLVRAVRLPVEAPAEVLQPAEVWVAVAEVQLCHLKSSVTIK